MTRDKTPSFIHIVVLNGSHGLNGAKMCFYSAGTEGRKMCGDAHDKESHYTNTDKYDYVFLRGSLYLSVPSHMPQLQEKVCSFIGRYVGPFVI